MKKLINILLYAFIVFVFDGCQKHEKNIHSKKITLNLQEGDLPSLNPSVGVDLRSRCLYLALFEPLLRRSEHGHLEFAAAKKVDIDTTQTIYTFHLRPHHWSNGEPVTSSHFENAWRYALTPGSRCFRSDLFYPIKNAEKVKKGELPLSELGINAYDDQTLIVTLEHPTPYFLDLTASSFYSPLYHASAQEPCFFNGPFVVKERIIDQKLLLQQNPFYWDRASIDLNEIYFTMVKDPMTSFAMFEKGELDLVGDPFSPLPLDLIPALEKKNQIHRKPISRILYLLVNTETYPLHNSSLRKALSLSIDRNQLTEHLFFGEVPTLYSLPTTLSFVKNQNTKVVDEDCQRLFEEALRELQLNKENFPKLAFSYAELSGQKKLAEFIQSQWKEKLGIEIELVCNEWNIHSANLKTGNYQLGTLHLTTLYQDPMFYLDLFRNKQSSCNYCRWENQEYRYLLEESEKTTDPTLRLFYLQQAEQKLFEEMPVISLFTQNFQYLVNENIHPVISDLGIYDFKYIRVE